MKLDRNINPDGAGKYALLKMRQLNGTVPAKEIRDAIRVLNDWGLIHWGNEGPGEQFFVVKYKDQFASGALGGYHDAIEEHCKKLMESDALIERMTRVFNGKKLTRADLAAGKKLHADLKRWREYADEIFREYLSARTVSHRLPD